MARKKRLPFIPLQKYDQDAAYAGMQYLIENAQNDSWNDSGMHSFFKDSIYNLLYANFKWEGDITPVEAHAIERMLIQTGMVCAVRSQFDEETQSPAGIYYGRYNTAGADNVTYDFYGYPSAAACTGLNGVVIRATENFVLGHDSLAYNYVSPIVSPLESHVSRIACLLDEAYQSWRVAVETHKQGIVFDAPDNATFNLLSATLKKISANNPFIITRGIAGADRVNTLFRTGGHDAVTVYYQNFLNVWSLVLDLLGIENEAENKRERLVVEEAIRSGSLSRCLGQNRLAARQEFARELQKLGVSVTVSNAFAAIIREPEPSRRGDKADNEDV